jgi:hypothetical protein
MKIIIPKMKERFKLLEDVNFELRLIHTESWYSNIEKKKLNFGTHLFIPKGSVFTIRRSSDSLRISFCSKVKENPKEIRGLFFLYPASNFREIEVDYV